MINFLKKFRQTSLKENKVSKYVVYAFGEVILVVIGILIALAVNNWNSKRLENERADLFLKNLKIQVEKNLSWVDQLVEGHTFGYTKSKDYLTILESKEETINEVILDSLVMLNSSDYHLNLDMNIVIEGRDNGNISLLTSEDIRKFIYYLINLEEEINERERIINLDLNNHFLPYLNKNYNIRNLISVLSPEDNLGKSKVYKGNNYKVLSDQEFENLITIRIYNGLELLEMYIQLKEALESIHEML